LAAFGSSRRKFHHTFSFWKNLADYSVLLGFTRFWSNLLGFARMGENRHDSVQSLPCNQFEEESQKNGAEKTRRPAPHVGSEAVHSHFSASIFLTTISGRNALPNGFGFKLSSFVHRLKFFPRFCLD
jgi:hypothetical protein